LGKQVCLVPQPAAAVIALTHLNVHCAA
jgi:hypothetical protein